VTWPRSSSDRAKRGCCTWSNDSGRWTIGRGKVSSLKENPGDRLYASQPEVKIAVARQTAVRICKRSSAVGHFW